MKEDSLCFLLQWHRGGGNLPLGKKWDFDIGRRPNAPDVFPSQEMTEGQMLIWEGIFGNEFYIFFPSAPLTHPSEIGEGKGKKEGSERGNSAFAFAFKRNCVNCNSASTGLQRLGLKKFLSLWVLVTIAPKGSVFSFVSVFARTNQNYYTVKAF